MTDLVKFLLICLATWRLTSLIVSENGPFDIFARLRYLAGVRYDERSVAYGKNVVAQALTCVWCFGLWVSIIAGIFSPYSTDVATYIVNFLAISAIVVIIEEMVKR